MSRAARGLGLSWDRSRVGALERGEKAISPEELALLPRVLAEATGNDVALGDLIPDDATIRLSDAVTVSGQSLRATYAGTTLGPRPADRVPIEDFERAVRERFPDLPFRVMGEAEQKVAARLGVTPGAVADTAVRLWGHSLAVERDRIVDERHPDASADRRRALRGRVTRQLVAQIAERIEGDRGKRP